MSHPEKDELIFILANKFYSGVMGSPAGETKMVINTPSVALVDEAQYEIEEWDNVYIDRKFDLNSYTILKNKYPKLIRDVPEWMKESNEV